MCRYDGALVCRRWADCKKVGLHKIPIPSSSLVLRGRFNSLNYFGVLLGCWRVSWNPSRRRRLEPTWHGIFWLINLNFFQQRPKEMLLFPSAQRKRAWLGFIFMTSHFFAGKHSVQITDPTLCKRTHKHRSASENASPCAMGKLQDQTHLSSLRKKSPSVESNKTHNGN